MSNNEIKLTDLIKDLPLPERAKNALRHDAWEKDVWVERDVWTTPEGTMKWNNLEGYWKYKDVPGSALETVADIVSYVNSHERGVNGLLRQNFGKRSLAELVKVLADFLPQPPPPPPKRKPSHDDDITRAILAERERCAKVAEDWATNLDTMAYAGAPPLPPVVARVVARLIRE